MSFARGFPSRREVTETRTYGLLSADSHLEVSPDRWVPHVDPEFHRWAPRVVTLDTGGDAWEMPATGIRVPLGLNFFASSSDLSKRFRSARISGVSYSSGLYGAGDARQRLQELDMDEVEAEVLFPAIAGSRTLSGLPPEAHLAIIKGYNDWLSKEFCEVDPRRLLGIALLPPTGIDDCVEELVRVASMPGIRGVMLDRWPNGSGGPDLLDDRFWQKAIELKVPLTAHVAFGGGLPDDPRAKQMGFNGGSFAKTLSLGWPNAYSQAQLIAEGVLDRFPELRMYFAETGIHWVPGYMESADDMYQRHHFWANVDLPHPPSWYVRRHFKWGFQRSVTGLRARSDIGVENLMWGSDFPHMASNFPDSAKLVDEQCHDAGLSDADERSIFRDNCVAFFGLDEQD